MRPNRKVRVAIVGVGNCASAFVQGVEFYRAVPSTGFVPGLMHTVLGGLHVNDIEFSAAFDVDQSKVGKDLSEAIFSGLNNTKTFSVVPPLGVQVYRGAVHDGLGEYLKRVVHVADGTPVDVGDVLRSTHTDVVVNFLPVGSEDATRWYAGHAISARCGFVNCIPVFIASRRDWSDRFARSGLPVVGDDIKSQVGATIVHRVLTKLFRDRGVRLVRTYQLNFGGNTDFYNMLESSRLSAKRISKTNAVSSQLDYDLGASNIHVGPSDHVPWLQDRKWCHIKMEGETFGGVPLELDLKLEVWDSPNSAGVVIDAVRCCKLAMENGLCGPLESASAYFMKTPPEQFTDDRARELLEEFIRRYTPPGETAVPEIDALGSPA